MTPDPKDGLNRLGETAREQLDGKVSSRAHDEGRAELLAAFEGARAPQRRVPAFAFAAVALALMIVGGAWFALREAPGLTYRFGDETVASAWFEVPEGSAPRPLTFSDGTHIELQTASRARMGEVGPNGARVVLESGALDVDVVHRPKGKWSIEAGPYTVFVTGTRFRVEWDSDVLLVQMQHGNVIVKGPLAPEGVAVGGRQRLTVREHSHALSVTEGAQVEASAAIPDAGDVDEGDPGDSEPDDAPVPPGRPPHRRHVHSAATAGWAGQVADGEYDDVVRAATGLGVTKVWAQKPLVDLVALADAARYLKQYDLARGTLNAERARFPHSKEAQAAEFLLGRVAEEEGNFRTAGNAYDTYLRQAPHGPLAQEALGRKLALAWEHGDAQRGEKAAARPAARAYLSQYPDGPYAHIARDLVAAPE